jgi:hypothetical protein
MWTSKKKVAWGHSPAGVKALGGPAKVREWDAATPKGSLKRKAAGKTIKLSQLARATSSGYAKS